MVATRSQYQAVSNGDSAMANGDGGKPAERADLETPETPVNIPIHRRIPDYLQSVNLSHVRRGYHLLITHAVTLLVLPLFLSVGVEVLRMRPADILQLWEHLQFNLVSVVVCSAAIVFGATVYVLSRARPVYLVEFACCQPEPDHEVDREYFISGTKYAFAGNEKAIDFQSKIIWRSGLGDSTFLPKAVRDRPPNPTMDMARKEAEEVMFSTLENLFAKTGVKPKEVDILIVNCSLFNPTPSLSAMIVNHFKMRGNVKTYNLGGMGCSAGVISIDLARDLLQVHRNSLAIVVSTENITQNWYFGNDRSMMIPNCLFRMGGAAILLSNRARDGWRAKYELLHTVRTNKAADDRCYNCVFQKEDEGGKVGVSLSKDLMAIAGETLKANITTLGPLVLPLSEQILFFVVLVARKLFKMKMKPYIPDFKLAFEHFCIHAGGRGVIDEMEKNLQLREYHTEPSRMTLYKWGNTSSSSIWYELAYSEYQGRVRRGDRVWQIAFGSGFKCNSAVWRALRTIQSPPDSVWIGTQKPAVFPS